MLSAVRIGCSANRFEADVVCEVNRGKVKYLVMLSSMPNKSIQLN